MLPRRLRCRDAVQRPRQSGPIISSEIPMRAHNKVISAGYVSIVEVLLSIREAAIGAGQIHNDCDQ
jgi:hypothetical protein